MNKEEKAQAREDIKILKALLKRHKAALINPKDFADLLYDFSAE